MTIMDRAGRIDDVLAVQVRLEDVRAPDRAARPRSATSSPAAPPSRRSRRRGRRRSPRWLVAQEGWDVATEVDAALAQTVAALQGLASLLVWVAVVGLPLVGSPGRRGRPAPRDPAARRTPGRWLVGSGGRWRARPRTSRPRSLVLQRRVASVVRPVASRPLRHHHRVHHAPGGARMRSALMTEPQQGYSYQDILDTALAAEQAGLRDLLPLRPLHELPGRGGPADDRRLDDPRRPRPRDRAHRPGVDGLAGHLPPARASSRRSWPTVDEMSGGRVEMGVGAGWNEREHAAAGHPVSRTRSGAWTGSRSRSRSCAGSGTSRTAGRSRVSTTRCGGRSSARRAGDPTSSSAATASRARCGSRRPTPTSTTSARPTPDGGARHQRPPRRRLREGRSRPRHDHALGHGRRARRSRRGRAGASGRRRRWRSSASDQRLGRRGSTSGATAGSSGRPMPRATASPPIATSACDRLLYQVFLPRDLEHVALLGELARSSGSDDAPERAGAASSGTRAGPSRWLGRPPRRRVSRSMPLARRQRTSSRPPAATARHALDEQALGLARVGDQHELAHARVARR